MQLSEGKRYRFVCVAAAIFAAATQTFGVPHASAIRYKGADDYIQNHGAAKFIHEVIAKCVSISEWEKQFDQPSWVDWNEPKNYKSTIGYWKSDSESDVTWKPRCNFDFAIERFAYAIASLHALDTCVKSQTV